LGGGGLVRERRGQLRKRKLVTTKLLDISQGATFFTAYSKATSETIRDLRLGRGGRGGEEEDS